MPLDLKKLGTDLDEVLGSMPAKGATPTAPLTSPTPNMDAALMAAPESPQADKLRSVRRKAMATPDALTAVRDKYGKALTMRQILDRLEGTLKPVKVDVAAVSESEGKKRPQTPGGYRGSVAGGTTVAALGQNLLAPFAYLESKLPFDTTRGVGQYISPLAGWRAYRDLAQQGQEALAPIQEYERSLSRLDPRRYASNVGAMWPLVPAGGMVSGTAAPIANAMLEGIGWGALTTPQTGEVAPDVINTAVNAGVGGGTAGLAGVGFKAAPAAGRAIGRRGSRVYEALSNYFNPKPLPRVVDVPPPGLVELGAGTGPVAPPIDFAEGLPPLARTPYDPASGVFPPIAQTDAEIARMMQPRYQSLNEIPDPAMQALYEAHGMFNEPGPRLVGPDAPPTVTGNWPTAPRTPNLTPPADIAGTGPLSTADVGRMGTWSPEEAILSSADWADWPHPPGMAGPGLGPQVAPTAEPAKTPYQITAEKLSSGKQHFTSHQTELGKIADDLYKKDFPEGPYYDEVRDNIIDQIHKQHLGKQSEATTASNVYKFVKAAKDKKIASDRAAAKAQQKAEAANRQPANPIAEAKGAQPPAPSQPGPPAPTNQPPTSAPIEPVPPAAEPPVGPPSPAAGGKTTRSQADIIAEGQERLAASKRQAEEAAQKDAFDRDLRAAAGKEARKDVAASDKPSTPAPTKFNRNIFSPEGRRALSDDELVGQLKAVTDSESRLPLDTPENVAAFRKAGEAKLGLINEIISRQNAGTFKPTTPGWENPLPPRQ